MENQVFDLKKIRELTSPVENLQGKVNKLTNLINHFELEKFKVSQYSDNESFLNQITEITIILESVNKNLKNIFTNNINTVYFTGFTYKGLDKTIFYSFCYSSTIVGVINLNRFVFDCLFIKLLLVHAYP